MSIELPKLVSDMIKYHIKRLKWKETVEMTYRQKMVNEYKHYQHDYNDRRRTQHMIKFHHQYRGFM